MQKSENHLSIAETFRDGVVESGLTTVGFAALAAMTMVGVGSRTRHSARIHETVHDTQIIGGGDWLALGGLSKHNGDFIIDELGSDLGPMASLHHVSSGVSRRSLGRALERYVERYYGDNPANYTIHAAVQSMGLVYLLEGIADCQDRGVKLPRLGTVLAFSSPTSTRDTTRHVEARLVNRLREYGYRGGAVTGAIGKFQQDVTQQRQQEKLGVRDISEHEPLLRLGRNALHSALATQWPNLWVDSVSILRNADLLSANIGGVVGEHTTFVHFGDTKLDDVVRLPMARSNLGVIGEHHGATVVEVESPGALHGDIAAMKASMVDALDWLRLGSTRRLNSLQSAA